MSDKGKNKQMKEKRTDGEKQTDHKAVQENPEHRPYHKNLSNLDI
jgi:hypothetical protein